MSLLIVSSRNLRACLLGALLAAAMPALHAAGACPKTCVSVDSVVHAAGMPPGLSQAVQEIEFDGNHLTAGARKAVVTLAKEAKALPAKAVVALHVTADDGLGAAEAKTQLAARLKALRAALKQAGAPAKKFKFSAG
jgi:hypothetical protein